MLNARILKRAIRISDMFLAVLTAVVFVLVALGQSLLPDSYAVVNSAAKISFAKIYSLSAQTDESVDFQSAESVGTAESELMLFGIIPVKSSEVTSTERQVVKVSGKPFGIKLYTDGVIVVGTKDIETDGQTVNPAKDAGLEVGDVIVSINSVRIYSSDDVEAMLNDNNGSSYEITVQRDGSYISLTLTPVYSAREGCYKAGIWVRDSTAGIGTITFFNELTGSFAALGHPVTDVDTGEIMPLLKGQAVEAKITSVSKSTSDETGSLNCEFLSTVLASIDQNTQQGVYGAYSTSLDMSDCFEYEVAMKQEVEKGFAQIICTIDGETPAVYSIEITKISYNDDAKNMVIKITDEELIEKTGGIVQGMSGTPIIQNGRLVGAITHVIVNNPLKGYAIFAQTMLEYTQ
ncbi:MAG: SpoIVB peptidase [Clostridiales bacterium]|nr:SpoIVB peptidase [Clostridiales bacterium]